MNEGASRRQEGSGAERRLERRSEEEEVDKDEESRTGQTVKLELDGMG